VREVMDPNVVVVGQMSYPTCGNAECDLLVLSWVGVDISELGGARDVRQVVTGRGRVDCVPLVVPFGTDAFCAACGEFVMHGVFCRDTHHAGLGEPHPDFADLI